MSFKNKSVTECDSLPREYIVPKSLRKIEGEIHSILGLMDDDSKRCRVSWVYQTVNDNNTLRYHHSRVFSWTSVIPVSKLSKDVFEILSAKGSVSNDAMLSVSEEDRRLKIDTATHPLTCEKKTRFLLVTRVLIGKTLTSIGGDCLNLEPKQLRIMTNRKQVKLANENNVRHQAQHLPKDTSQVL